MIDKIIGLIVAFGCALMFYCVGVYAQNREKPMWFWSGTQVDAERICNVKAYNRENARMWKLYSLWYFAAGIAHCFDWKIVSVVYILSCFPGLLLLVLHYNSILKKYSKR